MQSLLLAKRLVNIFAEVEIHLGRYQMQLGNAPQNLVYSEDVVREENVCVSDSPKNYIPNNNDGKKSLLAKN